MTKETSESFGYTYLRKQGWNDGKGLGRKQQGDVDPVKVFLKKDMGGVGHRLSDEFNNQWWDHVFNKAAAKMTVKTEAGGVVVKSEAELSTEKKQKLKQKILYGNFIKGSTLDQGQETHENNDEVQSHAETSKASKTRILTDEELLQACGGRTAHKGARHGLKLNGKLARLAAQDSQTKSRADSDDQEETISRKGSENFMENTKNKKAKKDKKRQKISEEADEETTGDAEVVEVKKKKTKKRKAVLAEDTVQTESNKAEDTVQTESNEAEWKSKSKKAKKSKKQKNRSADNE